MSSELSHRVIFESTDVENVGVRQKHGLCIELGKANSDPTSSAMTNAMLCLRHPQALSYGMKTNIDRNTLTGQLLQTIGNKAGESLAPSMMFPVQGFLLAESG